MNNQHFPDRRWGVFNHFLYGVQNNPESPMNLNRGRRSWNTVVDEFDTEKMAFQLHKVGAEYYFITIMQGLRYMIAPNAAYDSILGTKPGEACSFRDLPLDLYKSLSKYDIDLCLYYTGDGPLRDPEMGVKMGLVDGEHYVTDSFVKKWASVLEEYACRYGDKVKAWWIDGCYREHLGYNDEKLAYLYQAVKKGNPNAYVALNNGVKKDFAKNYIHEDFVTGEFNDFRVLPDSKYIDGARAHILAPLGEHLNGEWGGWCRAGLIRSASYLTDYIRLAGHTEMPVTIDVALYVDSSWDKQQEEVLEYIGKHI